MSMRSNTKLVTRLFDEAWNQGNINVLEELLSPSADDTPASNLPLDSAHDRTNVRMLRSAFPDWRVTIEEQIAMPDRVVTRWRAEGTHHGYFMGLPPTHRHIEADGISVFFVSDGRIQDVRVSRDSRGMLQQVWSALMRPEETLCHS